MINIVRFRDNRKSLLHKPSQWYLRTCLVIPATYFRNHWTFYEVCVIRASWGLPHATRSTKSAERLVCYVLGLAPLFVVSCVWSSWAHSDVIFYLVESGSNLCGFQQFLHMRSAKMRNTNTPRIPLILQVLHGSPLISSSIFCKVLPVWCKWKVH